MKNRDARLFKNVFAVRFARGLSEYERSKRDDKLALRTSRAIERTNERTVGATDAAPS